LLNIVVLIGCLWSVIIFLNDKDAITKSYLVAKVMPTVLDDDHIRFSWLISLSIILLNWQMIIESTKIEKIIGGILCFLLIVYLHLLASKTGLLCLYASIFVMIFYFLFKKETRKISLLLLVSIAVLAFIAYRSFPTLHNRVQYVLYDFNNYSNGKIETGSSDGARVLSMKAGWFITKQHPYTGVGFGDLKNEIISWHQQFHPTTQNYERFIPTNEWLIYSAASGWLGVILFSAGLIFLLPFFSLKNIFSVCLMMSLMIPLITDDSLEGQYGVAIFSLVICLGYYLKKFEPLRHKDTKLHKDFS
ncbi:MAG: O-antigen ligase family protein, partial [Bacteroidota bacterium]|nr:O-antigen ligase family protein [Bacteroidota bacterium]